MNSWHLFYFAKTVFPLSCRTLYPSPAVIRLVFYKTISLWTSSPSSREGGGACMLQRSQCSPNGAEAGSLHISLLQKVILEYMIWLVPKLSLPGLLIEDPWSQYSTLSMLKSQWRASLVAQLVKNVPATRETWTQSLVGKISWRRERLCTPVFWPGVGHNWELSLVICHSQWQWCHKGLLHCQKTLCFQSSFTWYSFIKETQPN